MPGSWFCLTDVVRAEFEFTSQYVVQADDFFLRYLQKVVCRSLYFMQYVTALEDCCNVCNGYLCSK